MAVVTLKVATASFHAPRSANYAARATEGLPTSVKGNDYHEHEKPNEHTIPPKLSCFHPRAAGVSPRLIHITLGFDDVRLMRNADSDRISRHVSNVPTT